jgi:hypothetical protein
MPGFRIKKGAWTRNDHIHTFAGGASPTDFALTPAEVKRMVERYGDRTLQMGNLADGGSLQIPVDCILEAVRVLGNQKVGEALHGFQAERVATALESVETLMENVISARRRKVLALATAVQEAQSHEEALEPWKRLEDTLFGP